MAHEMADAGCSCEPQHEEVRTAAKRQERTPWSRKFRIRTASDRSAKHQGKDRDLRAGWQAKEKSVQGTPEWKPHSLEAWIRNKNMLGIGVAMLAVVGISLGLKFGLPYLE